MTVRTGVYPGTFDPITLGHMDIIRRGAKLCDRLVIGVTTNPSKNPMFTVEERMEMVKREVAGIAGEIHVVSFDSLLMDFAEREGASMIVRGLRAVADFEYEYQMAGMNQQLNSRIETVFLMADVSLQPIASRLVKEIALYGGDIRKFVPAAVHAEMTARIAVIGRKGSGWGHAIGLERLSRVYIRVGNLMRLFAALAATALMMFATPALAQGGGGKARKPAAEPLKGVSAEDVNSIHPAVVPADPAETWVLDLSTGGRVLIRLRPDAAPKMVERIKTLTRRHFYDGLTFHRVVDDPYYMAQGGDPKGNGTGDSDLPNVPAEFNNLPHVRGTVAAARRGAPDHATPAQKTEAENSANSQFYIMMSPKLAFDHDYTVFGRVVAGMEWVDKIERGEPPANPTKIVHAYIQSDNPPPYANLPADAPKALPPGEVKATLPQ